MKRAAILLGLVPLLLLLLLGACSSPDEGARVNAGTLQDERDPTFVPFSAALVYSCGTLDCHGNHYRNLRLYGYGGLRKSDVRSDFGNPTLPAPDELAANYQALMGLEPEKMAEVVRDGGKNPERLTLVRKARATENHKGGPVVVAGSDMDRCLTSWLTGRIDDAACRASSPWKFP